MYLVRAIDSTGLRHGWACRGPDDALTCVVAPAEDVEPPATLITRVSGPEDRPIELRSAAGTLWTMPAGEQLLTVGEWELGVVDQACQTSFTAAPWERIEARITIGEDGTCRMEIEDR